MSHTAHHDSGTYVLELPWDAPPLHLNQRLHHHEEARIIREVRDVGRDLGRRILPHGMAHPSLTLVWLVTTRHRRDEDNIVPTLKALADGICDAGVVEDDTPEYMHKAMPIIAYAKGHPKAPGLHLVVWDQGGPTTEQVRAVEALGARLGVTS
jgi:crossover junction endodeoxyribonuclease RusA